MMNPDKPELFNRLREHSLRPTRARRLVLALLCDKNDHLNTDGIRKSLRNNGYPLSLATLYQNLNKLVDAGLLVQIKGPDGLMRFDANLSQHHHLICIKCSKMIDVKINQETVFLKNPVEFQTGITIADWQINHIKAELLGTCPDCQK